MINSKSVTLKPIPAPGRLLVDVAFGVGLVQSFQVDTGSTGFLVPYSLVASLHSPALTQYGTTYNYLSSGNAYQGYWANFTVTIGGPDGVRAQVPAFVVTQGPKGETDWQGGMMGIAYETTQQASSALPRPSSAIPSSTPSRPTVRRCRAATC